MSVGRIKLGRALLCVGVSVSALSVPNVAMAQKEAAAKKDGDIIVTARRQEERLQDVPVAVAAFGEEQLNEQRIISEADLQSATPGLTVRTTSSSNQINYAIRGQSIDSFSYSSPAVVAYFNEVQTGGTSATAFFDLASIQVLKGPQGTLFGRNATGGAVLYASKKPTDEATEGYLKVGYGNYDNTEIEGAINLPLDEGMALRVAGKYHSRDGYQRNLYNDTRLNSIDAFTVRGSLLIAPVESNIENILVFQYGDYGGRSGGLKMLNANGVNGAPSTYVDPDPAGMGGNIPLNTSFGATYVPDSIAPGEASLDPRVVALGFNGIADFLTKQASSGFYDVYNDRANTHDATQKFVSNTTTLTLSDDIKLKNIFGYNNVLSFDPTDVDGSPFQWLTIGHDQPFLNNAGIADNDKGYTYGTRQISNEFQIQGSTGALDYIVGAFWSEEKTYNRIPLAVTPDLGGAPLGRYDFTVTDKSKALFAQLTYAVTDRLNVTGGFRYTWEDVSIKHGNDSLFAFLNAGNSSRKDSKPSWLIGIDYKVTDDLLLYFNQRGSWRTGGFNGTATVNFVDPSSFEPETTYDFEAGMKFAGSLGAMPARLNIAVYDQHIKNVQRAPYIGISAVGGNVKKARVTGVEIDGSFDITDWFQLGGAFTYTDARYTNNVATVGGNPFFFGPYADTPEMSGSAFFRASHELENGTEIALRGDMYAQKSFYFSNADATISPGTLLPGYALFNARLEANDIGGSGISAAAYIQNITKEEYYTGGIALSGVFGANAALPGTPRMYGAELSFEF